MKSKSKIIASSLLTIALAGSVVIGTTYALFTSNASNNVEITAGRVKVTSKIDSVEAFTPDEIGAASPANIADNTGDVKKFGLGGTAKVEGNNLILQKMLPGDKVTIKLTVANDSNVTIKQRDNIEIVSDSGLASGLACTYDGNPMVFGKTVWETKTASDSITHTIIIELPSDAGEIYQEKSCCIRFSSEGVQANASVNDVFAVKHVDGSETGYASLQEAFNNVGNGETVVLNESATIVNEINVNFDNSYSGIMFDGNENILTMNISDPSKDGIRFKDSIGVKDLYVQGYARAGLHFRESSLTNVLENVHVSGEYRVAPISFTDVSGGLINNCSFSNSIDGDKAYYAPYDVPFALSMFANRNSNYKVNITNTTMGMLFVNGSNVTFTEPKVVLGDGAVVESIFNGSYESDVVISGEDKVSGPIYCGENGFITDKKVENTYYVINPNGLNYFSNEVNTGNKFVGKTIKLLRDINMEGVAFNPIGVYNNTDDRYTYSFGGIFDGDGKTIKNLVVDVTNGEESSAGLFASMHTGTAKNIILDNAKISSDHYAGGIIGWFEGNGYAVIENCVVKNSSILSRAHVDGASYNDGDKVGGIAGYVCHSVVEGCTVKDCTIQGYRDVGGIAGYMVQTDSKTTNCSVENVVITNDRTHNYKGYTTDAQFDVHEIVGELVSGDTTGSTFTNVTFKVINA